MFKSAGPGVDTIVDFKSGTDTLHISASGFGGDLKVGETVTLVNFGDAVDAGKSAFLFDHSGDDAGTIYWDADGGSSANAVAIARIGGSTLLDTDFKIG